MSSDQDVFAFIRSSFRSVWALELLCHLRQNRERSLSHSELVGALRGSDLVVAQSVESLAAGGLVLVEADGSVRYAPASAQLAAMIARTEALYAQRPDAVRRAIVAAAYPGAADFADAFRLRKD